MNKIDFKIVTDIVEAEKAWKLLSPNSILFDDWDFRYGYYKYFLYPIMFYCAYDENSLVGVLPLMWNEEKEYLEFFASFGYMENNTAFVKPGYEFCIPLLVQQIDRPALLEYMAPTADLIPGSLPHDNEYYADLSGLNSYHDFIDTYMSGSKKRNIISQFKKLENTQVKINEGELKDIDLLIYWSKIRFGMNSSFYRRPHFEKFITFVASNFDSRIITAKKDGKIEGVGLVVFYNDICFGISTGYNPDVSNLGKYISAHKINIAIKENKRMYAAGTGSPNWKEDFNLLKKPQYQLDLRDQNKYGQYNISINL